MMKNAVKLIGTLALIVLVGGVVLVLLSPRPSTPLPLPKPNSYDDLVKAGQLVLSEPSDRDSLSIDELRSLVAGNADALRLARDGLRKQCRVPLDYSMNYLSNHLSDLSTFKRLVRSFLAEGRLAERENCYGGAAQAYLDAVRLGHECCRGGVIIDMLVGVAFRSLGCQAMEGVCAQLQATDCREAIRQMEELEATSQPGGEVLQQERIWSRRTFGWRGRIAALVMRGSLRQNEQKMIAKLQAQQKVEGLLLIGLAAHAYELEKGQRLKIVGDLVPVYLKRVPQDPLTGASMASR